MPAVKTGPGSIEAKAPDAAGEPARPPRLLAVDFETADYGADSACAIGLVQVEGGRVQKVVHRLIRPPRRDFVFTYMHGIRWQDVSDQPSFAELWPDIARLFRGVDYVVAHNARFDRGVLAACCAAAGLRPPARPYVCTVKLARAVWGIYPTKLPDVCRHLAIGLKHHDPASDALAAAHIALAALAEGHGLETALLSFAAGRTAARPAGRL